MIPGGGTLAAVDDISSGSGPHTSGADPHASAAGSHTSGAGPHGYSENKQALLGRLRRIEGQVRGVHRMVDEDTYCIDVLTQISAATRALQAVAVGLLEDHLSHCVVEAARDGGDPAAKVKEATDAIARLVRS